jgi:hypothetical protein
LLHEKSSNKRDFSAAEKIKKHGSDRAEGFQRAIGKPFGRLRRGETPAFGKKQLWSQDQQFGRAHLVRHSIDVGKAAWGRV